MATNNPIEQLNKVFDHRIRLGIVSAVLVTDGISFNELKELLQITDGNLASHIKALEEQAILCVHKGFLGKKTNTTYSLTKVGTKLFKAHITALENLFKTIK